MATVTKPTHLDFLLDLQNQWIIGIITFFVLSLLFGMSFGYEPDWPFTVGWVACGILTLFFITQAFPDVWNYTFWLIGIYILTGFGIFSLMVLEESFGRIITIVGYLSEITGIGLAFYLILHLKNLRDGVSGVSKSGVSRSQLLREGRYIPLGLWSLSIMIFWLCTNLSIWGWFKWATDGTTIGIYVSMELLILFLGLYILWVPQTNFRWSASSERSSKLDRPLKSIIINRIPKTILKGGKSSISNCPICGYALNIEVRSCPGCGRSERFYWCPRSEVFIKKCGSCSKPISFNVSSCPNCGITQPPEISCRSCGANNRIRDWKRT